MIDRMAAPKQFVRVPNHGKGHPLSYRRHLVLRLRASQPSRGGKPLGNVWVLMICCPCLAMAASRKPAGVIEVPDSSIRRASSRRSIGRLDEVGGRLANLVFAFRFRREGKPISLDS